MPRALLGSLRKMPSNAELVEVELVSVIYKGWVGLVAAIGIALTRHVSGFALVAAPFIALFVGLLWFPLDLAAACFCVDNRRESCGEWPAAFWLTAEALFVIGVCTALPMA